MTGGNRGIGRTIAEAFVANGDQVAITYRSGEPPEGVLAVKCDVTDPESVDAAFAEVEAAHGPVEILVANAGITADTLVLRKSSVLATSSSTTSPGSCGASRSSSCLAASTACSRCSSRTWPRSLSKQPRRRGTRSLDAQGRTPSPSSSSFARSEPRSGAVRGSFGRACRRLWP